MEREILFRGKTPSGKWVYGEVHIATAIKPHIHQIDGSSSHILSETVGQFTGLTYTIILIYHETKDEIASGSISVQPESIRVAQG